MSMLIYIHGTNGSGKSTLARHLMGHFGQGEVVHLDGYSKDYKATYTKTDRDDLIFAGKYANACGGVDGISPYDAVYDVMKVGAGMGATVIAEGLITPGIDSCKKFASLFDSALFIHLNTPIETCIEHVKIRRAAANNDKPFNPENLIKKRRSAESWARRMKMSGMNLLELNYGEAFERIVSEIENG